MRTIISRWFLFGLLLGWSLTHATVFGQPAASVTTPSPGTGGSGPAPKAATTDKVRAGLDKVITVDYTGQSINDVLNHLRQQTNLTISIDQMAVLGMGMNPDDNVGQITVKATKEKTSQVLRKLLNPYRLCYIVQEDSVLVTSEEMAVFRQLRQRVSVDVEEVPFKKAVRDLAKTHGLNLVIDPLVMKQTEIAVSLQVENTGVETAVRLLAEMARLKAVRMGNVMFITNEEKAKKIREEESQTFDNPLNPNIPIGPGGFGGGFGGIAMPPRIAPAIPGIPVAPDGVVPPPPPGIDLPPAPAKDLPARPDDKVAPKKVIDLRNPMGAPGSTPAAPQQVDRPAQPVPVPAPRPDPVGR
jgi:hypothetical protein